MNNGRSECPVVVYVALVIAVVVSLATPQLAGFGWSSHATAASLRSVWGDLDGDGRADQLSIVRHGDTTGVEVQLSAGLDGPSVFIDGASSVSVADVDGDGDLDLITASATSSELWINDGRGSFTLGKRTSTKSLSAPAAFDGGVDHTLAALATPTPSVLGPAGFRPAQGVTRIRAPGYEARFSDSVRCSHLLRGPPSQTSPRTT
jgi:hypothetical protein